MEKRYTHPGVPIIALTLLTYLFIIFWVIFRFNGSFYSCLLITAFLLFGILCVYNITITLDNTYISFKLGIGLIKKKYRIANIKSCEPYGGISKRVGVGYKRTFAGGVLKYFIVTGFKAIELRFHDNDKLTVLIGTPMPEEISKRVQLLIRG
jgi:hypothetical protein